jgi:four helix bundle protein
MGSHRTLKAWQHAKILAVECARAARGFPPEEQGALADQLRRSAYSAALNIAEGCSRRGAREYRRFLDTARCSLDEVDTILELSKELGYIPPSTLARLEARRDEAAKTLFGLLRAIGKSAAQPPGTAARRAG